MSLKKTALFQLASGSLAIDAATIESIIERPALYRFPQLPSGYRGISIEKGRAIPTLEETRLPGGEPGKSNYLVVCQSEYGLVALPVMEVGQIVETREGAEEGPGDAEQPGSIGYFLYRGVRYPIVNVDLLLGSLN